MHYEQKKSANLILYNCVLLLVKLIYICFIGYKADIHCVSKKPDPYYVLK